MPNTDYPSKYYDGVYFLPLLAVVVYPLSFPLSTPPLSSPWYAPDVQSACRIPRLTV